MTTARDLITGSLKIGRVLRRGEDPTANEASDALTALNDVLSTWSLEGLMVPFLVWENFSLVAGTETYLIGTSQTFNTTRPIKIDSAYIRSGSTDYFLTMIGSDKYNAIPVKSTQGTPEFLNYDPQYPYAKIRLYPAPNAADSLYIQSEKIITSFATLDTSVSLPEGWENALKHGLWKRLAPEYGKSIAPDLALEINKAIGAVKSAKARQTDMSYSPDQSFNENILSG